MPDRMASIARPWPAACAGCRTANGERRQCWRAQLPDDPVLRERKLPMHARFCGARCVPAALKWPQPGAMMKTLTVGIVPALLPARAIAVPVRDLG